MSMYVRNADQNLINKFSTSDRQQRASPFFFLTLFGLASNHYHAFIVLLQQSCIQICFKMIFLTSSLFLYCSHGRRKLVDSLLVCIIHAVQLKIYLCIQKSSLLRMRSIEYNLFFIVLTAKCRAALFGKLLLL
jgi:hypothetical protein